MQSRLVPVSCWNTSVLAFAARTGHSFVKGSAITDVSCRISISTNQSSHQGQIAGLAASL